MYDIRPLTPELTGDLAALFEQDGTTRGCWCMHWRLSARGWRESDPASRRAAFEAGLGQGPPPGLLAYRKGEPTGWVQVTPRSAVPRFNAARTARPEAGADLDQVWALSCFFIRKDARGGGLMTALARAACALAADHGAVAVEAAPIEPRRELMWGEGYTGIASALARAGFEEVERRTEIRPFMRWTSPSG